LFRTLIDYIAVDTSLDEPLTVTEVPLESADLALHGVDKELKNELGSGLFTYGVDLTVGSFFPGSYTKYGEVTPLLTGAHDDKFVIMGQGDEISLSFKAPAEPSEGMTRQYVFSAYGYYKDGKTDLAKEVGALPFAAMSNYPYPASENYPTDAEHQDYLTEWNTRIETGK